MNSIAAMVAKLDWTQIAAQLDVEGYALLPRLLAPEVARNLAEQIERSQSLRCVSLETCDLGRGNLYFFGSRNEEPWSAWRTAFYPELAAIANRWNETLNVSFRYPGELDAFEQENAHAGQTRPLSHLSRLGVDDFMSLHQLNDDERVFPLQVVALLTEPGIDFAGGEFVMTEQRPRMQSRPMVLPLGLGDAAIITTAQRPFRRTKGYHRVNLKHAISRVRSGERIGVELAFHASREIASKAN